MKFGLRQKYILEIQFWFWSSRFLCLYRSRCSTVGFYSTGVVGSREGVGETNDSGSGELSG